MVKFFKKLFGKNKVNNLFPNKNVELSELGGNYCSDACQLGENNYFDSS